MSVSQNFPKIEPSLLLDFANVKKLDPRITFTRASEGRFYDGQTVAKAEENLLLQSESFSSYWRTTGDATLRLNEAVAPNGTTTAEEIYCLANNQEKRVFLSSSAGGNGAFGTIVFSVYLKAGSLQYAHIGAYSSFAGAIFNLSNGNVESTVQTGSDVIFIDAGSKSVGNGWYRCYVVLQTSSSKVLIIHPNDVPNPSIDIFGKYNFTTSDGDNIYIWGAQLEQRDTVTAYTPTTTQPITNYIPVLQTASANTARFDHDPVTGESLGLLVEEQRTNLHSFSQLLSEGQIRSSSQADYVFDDNAIIAPDGTLSGGLLECIFADGSTNGVYELPGITVSPADPRTHSVYLKKATSRYLRFRFHAQSSVNLGYSSPVVDFDNPNPDYLTHIGNGWYRFVYSKNGDSDTINNFSITFGEGNSSSLGSVYIWGWQTEIGLFPTSYIPTAGSQVTRSADAAVMTGENFSSWYRQDEGTLYADWIQTSLTSQNKYLARFTDAGLTNRIDVRAAAFTNIPFVEMRTNGSVDAQLSFASISAGSDAQIALAYKVNDVAGSLNRATPLTDSSVLVPVNVDTFTIGVVLNLSSEFETHLNGHIKKIAYYPLRLSNENLQALTS